MEHFLNYYGLDWAVLAFGLIGSFLIGNMRREGFICSVCACSCGLCVAILSHQYGFIVYNIILISLSTRNYFKWGRHMPSDRKQPALGAE